MCGCTHVDDATSLFVFIRFFLPLCSSSSSHTTPCDKAIFAFFIHPHVSTCIWRVREGENGAGKKRRRGWGKKLEIILETHQFVRRTAAQLAVVSCTFRSAVTLVLTLSRNYVFSSASLPQSYCTTITTTTNDEYTFRLYIYIHTLDTWPEMGTFWHFSTRLHMIIIKLLSLMS